MNVCGKQWFSGIVTALLLVALSCVPAANAQDSDTYELMRVFVDTFQEIDRNYVTDVDRRKLVEAGIRGMLTELDPYSNYISPDDLAQFNEAVEQEFGGVGIRVNFNRAAHVIEVTSPIPGSPAYKAGIGAGDRIVEIAGEQVSEFPAEREIDKAIEMLRGKPGEGVEVGVQHPGKEEIEHITLVRELIQLDTVMGYSYNEDGTWNLMYDDEKKIGYLRLTHFTRRSADEVRDAVKKLLKQGMKGLVLDLRFNPGGLLQAAVEISDMFIEEGTIVSTDGRNSRPRSWTAKRFGTFEQFPMAILVNHYSASASEIVSACLQDHGRAVVVGERSWGKGSVQNVMELEEGKSALKLTTAAYHRPSGKNIHRVVGAKEEDEWGVSPNDGYKIEFNIDQLRAFQRDRQERDVVGRQEPYESGFLDTQLQKAVEYVSDALEGKEQPKANEEDKKAAFRLPLFPVPRRDVG